MQAIITDSSCILDYIVLVGPHMPIVQFITYHVQRVNNWSFQNVARLSITSREKTEWEKESQWSDDQGEKHVCSLAFHDGSCKSFDVTEHENGKFRAGTMWGIAAPA